VLVVAALVLVAGGIAYALLREGPDDGDRAGSGTTTSPAASSTKASSSGRSSPSDTTTTPTSSASPSATRSTTSSATPSGTPSPTGALDRAAVASFVRGYFAAAPGGSSAAWSQLGPNEQAQGRASYNRFWRGIRSVGVGDIAPVAGASSVDVTLTYRTTDGRVSTERQRLDLIRSDDGGFLINGDEPAG